MKYKFGYLPSFGKELKALSKKYKSLKKDFEALKEEIENNPEIGVSPLKIKGKEVERELLRTKY